MIEKIISGAQTGVDIAALDAADKLGILWGGWCPMGYINENGLIPPMYQPSLNELIGDFPNDHEKYTARTKKNIEVSDATLIIIPEYPLPANIQDGTLLTIDYAKDTKKPYLLLNLSEDYETLFSKLNEWIREHDVRILNIGGPRESNSPGIYDKSFICLEKLFRELTRELRLSL